MKALFNLAEWDRMGRVLIGIALVITALGGTVAGITGLALAALGLGLIATGSIGFCPLYVPFRFRTRDK